MSADPGPPAMVATDLDGTLLRSDGTVSARTAGVLAAVEAAGVPVVFVTGRPVRWMDVVRAHVGSHGLAVCSNGAVVVDLRTDRIVLTRPVPVDAGRRAVAAIRAISPRATFAIEGPEGFAMEPGHPVLHEPPPGTPVAPIDALLERQPLKIMVRDPGGDPDDFLAAVAGVVAGGVEATRSDPAAMVELSAGGVTKATTLALLAERFGIAPAGVVAFGDMPNDLPMLAWAGRAFAMTGAHPAVLAAVEGRAGSNDEDGVATTLERLLGVVPR